MNVFTSGEVVHSVNILLTIGLIAVAWVIYKILILDNEEENFTDFDHHKTSDK